MALFRKRSPRDAFITAVHASAKRLGFPEYRYDDDLFALRLEGGGTFMLGNLFAQWSTIDKADATRYLDAALGNLAAPSDPVDTFEQVANLLLPGVRARVWLEASRWMSELDGEVRSPMPYRPLGENLLTVLLVDQPTSMMTVNEELLDGWGVTFDEALEAAISNLEAATPTAPWQVVDDKTYVSQWGDDYDASRLLLPSVVDRLDVEGDPVAFVPHRNRLIVTGDEDLEGLLAAMQITEASIDEPAQIAVVPVVRRNGSWTDWHAPAGHPVADALGRLQTLERSLAYGSTTSIIQSVVGDEIFVANSILAERNGGMFTVSTWIDAPCIIPESDHILFYRSDEEHWQVTWEDATAVVGDMMEPTGFDPPRYRVHGFPDDAQLDAMPAITA